MTFIALDKTNDYESNLDIKDLLKDNDLLNNLEELTKEVCDPRVALLFQTIACITKADPELGPKNLGSERK